MTIVVKCQCGAAFAAAPYLAGTTVRCPRCHGEIHVPAAFESPRGAQPEPDPQVRPQSRGHASGDGGESRPDDRRGAAPRQPSPPFRVVQPAATQRPLRPSVRAWDVLTLAGTFAATLLGVLFFGVPLVWWISLPARETRDSSAEVATPSADAAAKPSATTSAKKSSTGPRQ